jgi:hypothetical protein
LQLIPSIVRYFPKLINELKFEAFERKLYFEMNLKASKLLNKMFRLFQFGKWNFANEFEQVFIFTLIYVISQRQLFDQMAYDIEFV